MEKQSIFNYKYEEHIIDILEMLKEKKLKYIEISPIVPIDSEIKLPQHKTFNNKGDYTIASFDLEFNLINKMLLKNGYKNCYTALKGIFNGEECDYIFVQCLNISNQIAIEIEEYLNFHKISYKLSNKNEELKIIIKI